MSKTQAKPLLIVLLICLAVLIGLEGGAAAALIGFEDVALPGGVAPANDPTGRTDFPAISIQTSLSRNRRGHPK